MGTISFDVLNEEITAEVKRAAKLAGRDGGNLEDQIRAANELLRGLEIIASTKGEDSEERKQVEALRRVWRTLSVVRRFDPGRGTTARLRPCREARGGFNYLVSFLMSFASRIRHARAPASLHDELRPLL